MHRKLTRFLSLFLSAVLTAGTFYVPTAATENSAVYAEAAMEEEAAEAGYADVEEEAEEEESPEEAEEEIMEEEEAEEADSFEEETDDENAGSEEDSEEETSAGEAFEESEEEGATAESSESVDVEQEDEAFEEADADSEEDESTEEAAEDLTEDGEAEEDAAQDEAADLTEAREDTAEEDTEEAGGDSAFEGAEEAAESEETGEADSMEETEVPAMDDAEEEEVLETVSEEAVAEEVPTEEPGEAVQKAMTSVSIGGVTYFYVDTAGDAENTEYCFSVTVGRGASAVTMNYAFSRSDLTRVGDTDYYYIVTPGATALSGSLYGFAEGTGTATSYSAVYGDLGVSTDSDPAYDAVTSATGFTGFHTKDIPSLVTFGTDAEGEKAITGLTLGRGGKSVDATAYVEAGILQAAGCALTEEQEAALDITLKTNPMTPPSAEEIQVQPASASLTTSRYGVAEFAIVPDDTAAGYTWSEYWNSVYAATISDGTTTIGAVHWIDLYGEAATSGPHYNKLEIALNNGESVASNKADVSRYAAFFDENTGSIKAGTYTVKVYAEGYSTLEAQVEVGAEEMGSVSLGGVTYYYADTAGDDAMTIYQATVRARTGSTTYNFMKSNLTQVGETGFYYTVVPGTTALTGTLYGFENGTGTATNYSAVYGDLGVSTDSDPAYDAVTSATGFTGFHTKDIPSLVTFGTDAEGEKAITGLTLGRGGKSVDATAYVEAGMLQAAGCALTEEQEAALDITLKTNPMTAPSVEEIQVQPASASLTTSRYGVAEFAIVPDDTAAGYTWSEYWNSVYAATISDGTTTIGAVHWIDLYGEAATSGPHYNKLQIALNNGESVASNKADVSRYAAFFDEKTGKIKSGTYTITVYAEGYSTLTAQVEVSVTLADKTVAYTGEEISIDDARVSGLQGDVVYTYYSDEGCTEAMAELPKAPGTYYVKAVADGLVTSNAARLTISKGTSRVTLKSKAATYTGKTINVDAATVTGSGGKVTYAYYSDVKCTKKVTAHINAGTYFVRATVAADTNYKAATSPTVKLVIAKAASRVVLKSRAATYTGKTINVDAATVTGSRGKVTYAYYSDVKCTKKVTAHINAGTYYVRATVAADTNYKAATSPTVKLVIKKKAQAISVSTLSKTYAVKTVKAKAQTFAIGAKASGSGKLTYEKTSGSNYLSINKTTGTVTVRKATPKGTYTMGIKVTAAANTNYTAKTITKTIKVIVK